MSTKAARREKRLTPDQRRKLAAAIRRPTPAPIADGEFDDDVLCTIFRVAIENDAASVLPKLHAVSKTTRACVAKVLSAISREETIRPLQVRESEANIAKLLLLLPMCGDSNQTMLAEEKLPIRTFKLPIRKSSHGVAVASCDLMLIRSPETGPNKWVLRRPCGPAEPASTMLSATLDPSFVMHLVQACTGGLMEIAVRCESRVLVEEVRLRAAPFKSQRLCFQVPVTASFLLAAVRAELPLLFRLSKGVPEAYVLSLFRTVAGALDKIDHERRIDAHGALMRAPRAAKVSISVLAARADAPQEGPFAPGGQMMNASACRSFALD